MKKRRGMKEELEMLQTGHESLEKRTSGLVGGLKCGIVTMLEMVDKELGKTVKGILPKLETGEYESAAVAGVKDEPVDCLHFKLENAGISHAIFA